MTGIVSYGFYIPKYRIKVDEIAKHWGKDPKDIIRSLQVAEKAVSGIDEDALTMAYESASMALTDLNIDKSKIGGVFVGSESHPYVVNPTSTILADYLGIGNEYLAYDTQFACKAATGVFISALSMVTAGFTRYALVTATDRATGKPHDPLEYTAGSASVSLLAGSDDVLVEVIDHLSYSSDVPDFWRREGMRYPSHGGRFTGRPSYFHHVYSASEKLLEKTRMNPKDFQYAVFHMPNGKFPVQVAGALGFNKEQVRKSLVVSNLGNSYTASALMGLVSVLDVAKPGDLIFFASFGSGAGSDAFIFKVTKNIEKRRRNLALQMKNISYLNYSRYLKMMGVI
jgi:hydroxymethylglutaryl-CoA synthase